MGKNLTTIATAEKQLRMIAGGIKKNGRKILKNYPITSPQFIALQCIIDENGLTIGQLSEQIGLAFSTTTDLVDRMEKNDLVKRTKDSADRRVVRIHVLNKGETIVQEVIKERQKYLGAILDNFTDEEKTSLIELLNLLQEQMIKVNNKE